MKRTHRYKGTRFDFSSLLRALKVVSQIPLFALRPGNVAMFHVGRCGSSVLCDLLGQHPKIYWDGEVYRAMRNGQLAELRLLSDPQLLLRTRMLRAGNRFYGFETKFLPHQHLRPDLANMQLPLYIDFLRDAGFEHFIILERKNHLRRFVSGGIGQQTGQWRLLRGEEERTKRKVTLPTNTSHAASENSLLARIETVNRAYRELEEVLKDCNVLDLTYEDDILPDPKEGYRCVCRFLGLEPVEATINLKRQNPFPVSELIENFDEVERTLRGTPHAWMLHD